MDDMPAERPIPSVGNLQPKDLNLTPQEVVPSEQTILPNETQDARALIRKYDGLVPAEDETMFSTNLNTVVQWHKDKIEEQTLSNIGQADHGAIGLVMDIQDPTVNQRPTYHITFPPEVQRSVDGIYKTGVYNKNNYVLAEHPELQRAAEQALQDANATVLIPCMPDEKPTAAGNAQYATEVLQNKARVLVLNARGDEAIDEAVKGIAPVVSQNDILREVNWQQLIHDKVLPPHFPLKVVPDEKGKPMVIPDTSSMSIRKGITILSGQLTLIELQRAGVLPQGAIKILGHDGDVKNPQEYDALRYLGLGLIDNVDAAPHILRNGEGRNNEPWTQETNTLKLKAALAARRDILIKKNHLTPLEKTSLEILHARQGITDKEIDQLMAMGYALGAWGWPLTGEREFNPYLITSTGMDLETTYAVTNVALDITSEKRYTTQIANPNPKKENGVSNREREFSIVGACANWQDALVTHSLLTNRMPHEWNLGDVGFFNMLHGGMPEAISVQSDQPNGANVVNMANLGYVLPSPVSLIEQGYVNTPNILEKWASKNSQLVFSQ